MIAWIVYALDSLIEKLDSKNREVHDLFCENANGICGSVCLGCELVYRRRMRLRYYDHMYEFPTAIARYVKRDPTRRALAELGVSSYEDAGRLV